MWPSARCRSEWQTPAAAIRTSTSPGPRWIDEDGLHGGDRGGGRPDPDLARRHGRLASTGAGALIDVAALEGIERSRAGPSERYRGGGWEANTRVESWARADSTARPLDGSSASGGRSHGRTRRAKIARQAGRSAQPTRHVSRASRSGVTPRPGPGGGAIVPSGAISSGAGSSQSRRSGVHAGGSKGTST